LVLRLGEEDVCLVIAFAHGIALRLV
jgi:hypothetical protein